jgi:hypothetical protein
MSRSTHQKLQEEQGEVGRKVVSQERSFPLSRRVIFKRIDRNKLIVYNPGITLFVVHFYLPGRKDSFILVEYYIWIDVFRKGYIG